MSFIGSMFSNDKGSGFQANTTPIEKPTNVGMTTQAYGNAQNGLSQQQAFINALQAQNGIGNQSNVFGQQQGLANQLQGVANGTGPNPAQAQLNQATGQNIANQAAMMAGQRGGGSNVGLLARQAAQQGAATQQQAVGQGATLEAQQRMNALGALGQQQSNMANLATNQVGQQAGALGQYNQAAQSEQQNLLNSVAQQNAANVQMQSNINNANAGIAGINAQGQQGVAGGLLNGVSSAVGALFAHGGQVKMADGGMTPSLGVDLNLSPQGPMSNAGRFLYGSAPSQTQPLDFSAMGKTGKDAQGAQALYAAGNNAAGTAAKGIGAAVKGIEKMFAEGGKVPAMLSPGERYLSPAEAKSAAQGKVDASKAGEKIPGKAKVKGDSLANDIVPKTLQEGGLVIPKSVMESKNPKKEAAAFVSAHMKKMALGGKVKK